MAENKEAQYETKTRHEFQEEQTTNPVTGGEKSEKSIEEKIHQREKDQLSDQKREGALEAKEKEALRDVDEDIENHLDEQFIGRKHGLFKRAAASQELDIRQPEYFLQVKEQQQILDSYDSTFLSSAYSDNVQNLDRGRVTSFAPVPMGPINQYNMFPQNHFPVTMGFEADLGTLERLWQQPFYQLSHEDMTRYIAPDPSKQYDLSGTNFEDMFSTISNARAPVEMFSSRSELSEIIHPLNRKFTLTEDPYNQQGKNFRQDIGFEQGDSNITTDHILGNISSVSSNTQTYAEARPGKDDDPQGVDSEKVREDTIAPVDNQRLQSVI